MLAKTRNTLVAMVTVALMVAAGPAWAGNGHLLHGVGPVNSSLGGAGTGFVTDSMSALHANPALLTELGTIDVVLATEIFKDDLSATTQDVGEEPHTTESDGELGVLPGYAFSWRPNGGRFAIGTGLLAVAGFRTNWPVDPDSLLLQPQPNGFGSLQTELGVAKIPLALAYKVNDSFSLGVSLNIYQSKLIINPLPVVPPDCVGPYPGNCFRPYTFGVTTEYAFGLQLGLYYEINEDWSLGFSYTTEQDYDPFVWNSVHGNPDITTGDQEFGTFREIEINLDQPPMASLGVGWTPSDKLLVGFEVKWVGYADTDGIGGSGGIGEAGDLISIGWDDIWIWMIGVQYKASEKWTVRGGLNFNDNPIREEVTLNSGGTPSVFEQHYTIGASRSFTENFELLLGAYYTPENSVTGPFIGIEGATVTYTNSIISGLFGFSFRM